MCGPCSDGTYWSDIEKEKRRETDEEYHRRIYGNFCSSCGADLSQCRCWDHYKE